MFQKTGAILCFFLPVLLVVPSVADASERAGNSSGPVKTTTHSIWRDPGDVATRDLFYGVGGRQRQPRGRFIFVKEDPGGSNPKFTIRDQSGVEWKVKLGDESRAETAATRFLWGVGYYVDETYLVPVLRVSNMPRLRRGQRMIAPDGSMRNARLERYPAKKIGSWKWRRNPFEGTREINGLRVMMALLNNWDLKDGNTSIYAVNDARWRNGPRLIYGVGDVGASFATHRYTIPSRKENVDAFLRSKFITKVTATEVSFATPGFPTLISVFALPNFISRIRMRAIGRDIPIEDVRWITSYLERLSPRQIHSAFQAAGYSPAEVEAYASVIQNRIALLSEL